MLGIVVFATTVWWYRFDYAKALGGARADVAASVCGPRAPRTALRCPLLPPAPYTETARADTSYRHVIDTNDNEVFFIDSSADLPNNYNNRSTPPALAVAAPAKTAQLTSRPPACPGTNTFGLQLQFT
ncbi:unnamed protein product [Leptosia nina]|uniref:Uncharacterized protein n=1 Tax=Leptosia nina TaxID=320188 RepID=A0AAV1J6N5_9NEOP